jgi:hypothetical protein
MRSLGSVVRLLTQSPEYTDAYNAWLEGIPPHVRNLALLVKRSYRTEWGDDYRRHFSVDRLDGKPGNELVFDRKPGAKDPWTKRIWIYDLRTNKEFTLKERRMVRADLDEFVACYNPENRNKRKPTWDTEKRPDGRWRVYTYDELIARDKCSLDIFWLKDQSLEDSSKLPDPHVLAAEIAEDLRSALEQIESVLGDLEQRATTVAASES